MTLRRCTNFARPIYHSQCLLPGRQYLLLPHYPTTFSQRFGPICSQKYRCKNMPQTNAY